MTTGSIHSIFHEIIELQLALGHDIRPYLNPPATAEQIAKAEAELGFKLNEELKELYSIANGTDVDFDSIKIEHKG